MKQDMEPYNRALLRVNQTPALAEYRDTIMHDWPEGDEHWEWVANAPVLAIVSWAESIESDKE
jgi:hypothetical protein